METIIIGIAGGTASGKTTVAKKVFKETSKHGTVALIKIDDYYSLSLSELRDNGLCLKGAEYDVSSEFYDKIKEMSKSRKGINILEEDRGFDFGRITISEEAIKNNDNADILGIIFNETKTNGTLRYDEEIPDMGD